MDKELEMFIELVTLKHNLITNAKSIGFKKKKYMLFIKPDMYDLYLQFDDEYLTMWYNESETKYRKVIMYYEDVYDDINKGLYLRDDFLTNMMNMLAGN